MTREARAERRASPDLCVCAGVVLQDVAKTIERAGKSINFLRDACGDSQWVQDWAPAAAGAAAALGYGQVCAGGTAGPGVSHIELQGRRSLEQRLMCACGHQISLSRCTLTDENCSVEAVVRCRQHPVCCCCCPCCSCPVPPAACVGARGGVGQPQRGCAPHGCAAQHRGVGQALQCGAQVPPAGAGALPGD